MDKPFEIKVVQNNLFQENDITEYEKKPFKLCINGKEIENVKRFSIDLDKEKLVETKPDRRGGAATYLNGWTYLIEYTHEPLDYYINT